MGIKFHLLTPLLRVFFYLLYHQFAWTYDFIAELVSVGMWNEWIFSIVPHLTGERILELGHGPGQLQIALASQGRKVFGIDLSPQMVKICANRMSKRGHQAKLANSKAQHLPFPDNSFDQITSTFPTPYILAPETISEVHRVLVPGGEFIFLQAAWITGKKTLQKFASWLFRVTGQTLERDRKIYEDGLKPYKLIGFNTSYEITHCEESSILIFRGTKVVV